MRPDQAVEDERPDTPFPIVGIGASAGGLNSFECFIAALPKEFGFAIVFIQHLSPKHTSLVPGILRSSRPDLNIYELSDGLKILPGSIYVCPPAIEVRVRKGIFHVESLPEGHMHLPIDEFLVSLAEDAAERAIAVIFSGAGTDGARGTQAVRTYGGTVFVQDPETAEFSSMPLAAINAGQVDGVLPPADIAKEILAFVGSGIATSVPGNLAAHVQLEPFYRLIFEKTGYSFHHYKKSVVGRRIRRRLYLHGLSSVDEYLDLLARKDTEAASLASDIMIGVTSFFRDRLAWKALHLEVTRKLAALEDDSPIRVWTPACATGEEAYSIAMQLQHELDLAGKKREIQVFATDVNDRALEKAREGTYPGSISADVPLEFMHKFFTYSEDGLSVTINKEMRQHVIFAKQDILTDPPFSRLDLVICRNLLIYLEPDAQEKCIALFHYALRNGGYLFLGNAESPGRKKHLFKSISHKKCRLYQKVDGQPIARLALSVPFASERTSAKPQVVASAAGDRQSLNQFIQEALLEEYSPAAVAIDHNYDIIYHNGSTNRFLRQPRGAPTQNLLALLPENLRSRIRGALYRTVHEHKTVSIRTVIMGDDKRKRQAVVRISQLKDDVFIVIFREKNGLSEEAESLSLENSLIEETAVRQLESELSATRDELQNHIEQLKGLNEELQSSNEELQAANEELETSREELQSLNEELITVNGQFQSKIEEQEETNNDLNNFMSSTNIPTIFLDRGLKVRRFTPAMTKIIKLIPADIGRQIIDMSQELLGPDLIKDAETVLDNLVPIKNEISLNGIWYVRNALPYRTSDSRIEGVVVTYSDITDLRLAEVQTRHLASFPQLDPNPVIEVDLSGSVIFFNPATRRFLESLKMDQANAEVFLPEDFDDIVVKWDGENESSQYRELIIKDRYFGETIYLSPQFNVARIYVFDITESKNAEKEIVRAKEEWERTFDTVPDLIAILDCNHTVIRVNKAMADRLGLPPEKCVGVKCYNAVHGTAESPAFCPHALTCIDSSEHIAEVHEPSLGGDFIVSTTPIFDDQGLLTGAVHVARDITERTKAEWEREVAADFLRLVNESCNILDLVHSSTDFFQQKAGCEAVGIRLREEHDYPYFETRGFPKEFVLLENRLCTCDKDGQPILDSGGNPVLDCMCGNVICGRFDPSKPFFTKRGNFWSNNTTELLASTSEKDRQVRTRNRCNGEGYESVALIGLTLGDERLGLLQLNDKRPGRFTPESVALWERLADYLAVALAKFRSDEELRKSEELYRSLFENMLNGFAYCRMMFDQGRPLDFVYLAVNDAFTSLTGLKDVVGKKVTEVIPGIRETDPALFELYGRVALSGNPERIEIYVEAMKMWFSISVYSPQKEHFMAVFDVITERKRAEEVQGRLAAIVESAEDAIIGKDLNGIIQTWNAGAENIFGYKAEEVIGKQVSLLTPPGHIDEVPEIIARIKKGEHIESFETVRMRKDGTIIPVSLTFSAIKDARGGIIGASKIAHDITEQKRGEEALRRINEELTRFNSAAVGRELRMIELKKEVNELLAKAGEPTRYELNFLKEQL